MARFLSLLAVFIPTVTAWGLAGSYTGALVAQNYLTDETTTFCQSILGDHSDTFLAKAALWSKRYSTTPNGEYTIPLHSLPAQDSPPGQCSVILARDCPTAGCLPTAIANYTALLKDDKQSRQTRQLALRMLVTLVTSNTEPANNDKTNGANVSVLWNGVSTSLYNAWHNGIPNSLAGGDSISDAQTWAQYLISNINAGAKGAFPSKTSWLIDLSLCWSAYTSVTWSSDANSYMCTAVIPKGIAAVQGKELNGSYYQQNAPMVHRQVAKGGYRLAAWLNLIAMGQPALAVPLTTTVAMCNTTALTKSGATTPS